MRINKLAAAALLGISALGLSACATGLRTEVSRYQAMPAPQGQSFFIVPADPANAGKLEFARYAAQVAQAMQAQGYAVAPSLQAATMVVRLDYGVDEGEERVERDPFARGYGYDPFWGGYGPYGPFRRPYYSRFGYYGPRSPFYYGWNDPYWYAPYGGAGYGPGYGPVRVYTEYHSFLDLDIRRKGDNAQLFGGRAQARSTDDNLGVLVPNLIEAMFTGFPGRSGETIKITVPPAKRS
ncbi:MAG TPA: DUF4136 domain-containing protein [Sphingomicrobium sp.]|jgi:hypothetical protein|nr:DUF4136 domain-containing protein [Sphingomicrobium sp.]